MYGNRNVVEISDLMVSEYAKPRLIENLQTE